MSMTSSKQGRPSSSQWSTKPASAGFFMSVKNPTRCRVDNSRKYPLSLAHRQAVVWKWLMKVVKWIGAKIADNIAGVVLTAIGGVLFVYVAAMWEYTQVAWAWFTTPAQMSMGFVVISLILMAACVVQSIKARRSMPQPPAWKRYREDEFSGAIWRWDYIGNNVIDDLRPYCKTCDCALDLHFNFFEESIVYRCVSCRNETSAFPRGTTMSEALSTIHKLIDQRIRQRYSNDKKATS